MECKYFEVSAKKGTNIKELFSEITKDLIGRDTNKFVTPKESESPSVGGPSQKDNQVVELKKPEEIVKKKGGCCK